MRYGRTVAAIVVSEGVFGRSWRRLKRDPLLGRVPVVALGSIRLWQRPPMGIPFFAAGIVLMDVGPRLGLGRRAGLRWGSLVWIALALLAARSLLIRW